MGSQFIGLILLILAVAAGIYGITSHSDLLNLKVGLPNLAPVISFPAGSVPSPAPSQIISNPTAENRKSARIISIRSKDNFNQYSEVSVAADLSGNESMNITGWTVKSNKGVFSIPQAQEVYSFGGAVGNINLKSRDTVNLYSAGGPKGNFRLNKCMGYIEDVSPFIPSLPKTCPRVSRPEITNLSGACQDYILSLRACQEPSANPPVPLDDYACHNFLNKLTYVGCVEKYRKDSDFLSNDWRVWLGDQLNIFDPLHDKVQLLDQKGKVVDEYIY